jgi:RHS repeat-associated protein
VSQKFTGKERDAESGLDYFGARYYGSALGRFTSPDEVFADQHPADPQSWNLYGYVRNNPLKNVDPTGKGTFNAALLNNPEVQKAVANLSAGVAAYAKQSLNENKQGLNRISDLVKTVSGGRIDLGHVTITPLTPAEEKAAPTGAAVVGAVTAITGGVKGDGEGGTTSLFRAVGSAEAGDIGNTTGAFGASPTGSEFKGFFYSESDAQSFGARMTQMTGDPHTVVSADAPTDLVNASPAHNAATEGPGVLIKNENLPQVKIKQPNQ